MLRGKCLQAIVVGSCWLSAVGHGNKRESLRNAKWTTAVVDNERGHIRANL